VALGVVLLLAATVRLHDLEKSTVGHNEIYVPLGSGARRSFGDPALSVVVVVVGDTIDRCSDSTDLAATLDALAGQMDAPSIEVIVPYHARVSGVEQLKARFPSVHFLFVEHLRTFSERGGGREHHDELRARGMAAARGEIIGFLEDHVRPDPHWCARMLAAHRERYAAVGGAIENGVDRALNWAAYFSDLGRYQRPLPAGESAFASSVNVSYKRTALEAIAPVGVDLFSEPVVNQALMSRGEKLALCDDAIVYQHRRGLRLATVLQEFFVWGRSYAATRSALVPQSKRLMYASLSPALPALLLVRMTMRVFGKGRCIGAFLRAFPLTVLLTLSWSCGELAGYCDPRSRWGTAPEMTA
jgi:hypothetical protein